MRMWNLRNDPDDICQVIQSRDARRLSTSRAALKSPASISMQGNCKSSMRWRLKDPRKTTECSPVASLIFIHPLPWQLWLRDTPEQKFSPDVPHTHQCGA